jgi:hypothetical protein
MENQNSGYGLHLGSALVGFAAGVFGTILYAAYKEQEFNRVVGKTREMGDRSTEYLSGVTESARTKAVAMVDSAQNTVDNISEKVKTAIAPKPADQPLSNPISPV